MLNEPHYSKARKFKDPCFWCGKHRCLDPHTKDIKSYRFILHLRAMQLIKEAAWLLIDTVCHMCSYIYPADTYVCPRCKEPYDAKETLKALRRESKTYKDIVRDNKRREPKSNVIVKPKPPRKPTGFFAPTLEKKACLDCGRDFVPKIRSNRYGGSKRCPKCQTVKERKRRPRD